MDRYMSDVDGSWISGGRRLSGSPSPGGLGPSSPVSIRMEPGGRGYDDGAHLQKGIQSKHEYKWEYMQSYLHKLKTKVTICTTFWAFKYNQLIFNVYVCNL